MNNDQRDTRRQALTDAQRQRLAAAAASKVGRKCWNVGVEQIAHQVDGRVVICPWTPGSFSMADQAVIAEFWRSLPASAFIELVIVDHMSGRTFGEVAS